MQGDLTDRSKTEMQFKEKDTRKKIAKIVFLKKWEEINTNVFLKLLLGESYMKIAIGVVALL
ncbi:MAG TPA: hypothetical protein PLX69_15570, partial [Leptospiraceae bacterium]|nr:hypothetical protein [Leptospiraceae bacterium]